MTQALNKGGTAHVDDVSITFTDAKHSSSAWVDDKPLYLGEPAGIVLGVEDAGTIYFAGDTCVFGDMSLIGRIYEPDVAVLPIGDHYTMGPKEAVGRRRASRREAHGAVPLGHVRPPHRDAGRVPRAHVRLRGRRARAGTVGGDLMARERWFGATGVRVPEIAIEGDERIPLADALVVEGVADVAALAEAHDAGRPVVVRAADAESVRAALARPEVACVLVPADHAELLELDLRRLTYG